MLAVRSCTPPRPPKIPKRLIKLRKKIDSKRAEKQVASKEQKALRDLFDDFKYDYDLDFDDIDI